MGKLADVIDPSVLHELTDETVVGIDIGSRGAKAVLLSIGGQDSRAIRVGPTTTQDPQDARR